MKMQPIVRAFIAAFSAAALALGSAAGIAVQFGSRAKAVSHEQPKSTKQVPGPNMPQGEAVAKGRTLFLNSCAHCHGADARGDEGPDLHELDVSDRQIVAVIKHGIKGEMPSFAKKHSDEDISLLIEYLRSL
jgi:mono/diheme cytochrome c family protein